MKKNHHFIVYPNATPAGVLLRKNVAVPMRDGVKLAVDIYQPDSGHGPWPVILAYSPFQKERFFESPKPAFYCPQGYVCVQAAERGSGFSQGKFEFHGSKAGQDGYDLVEWIAVQSWSNDNIAMMGASGYGVMAWLTASLNPPHLKALAILATTDNYRGLCYPGGVLRKGFVQNLVSGLTQAAIWPGPIAGKEPPINMLAEILSHTEDGPFWWEHGGTWMKIDQIRTPVLNIVNTPNRLHAVYHLRSYEDIRSPKKLVITPWTNENYQPWIFETTAMNQYLLRWLDYWLKGIDTGIMDEPEIAIYDNGTGRWHYEDEYPLTRTRRKKYYLHAKTISSDTGGLIDTEQPSIEEKAANYDNISLNTAMLAAYGIQSPGPGKPSYLTYLSAPLEEDLIVWGPLSMTLYASTTEEMTSDWSFFIKIGEMVPQGVPRNPVTGKPEIKPEANDQDTPKGVQLWSWGCLKAKYRAIDSSKSRPGLPWHPCQHAKQLSPNTIYEFKIELQPVFKTFKKGCRLWLKIASDDALFSTLDSSSGYVETPREPADNRISIYHDAVHPTHLDLPVIDDIGEQKPVGTPLRDALPGAVRFTSSP